MVALLFCNNTFVDMNENTAVNNFDGEVTGHKWRHEWVTFK